MHTRHGICVRVRGYSLLPPCLGQDLLSHLPIPHPHGLAHQASCPRAAQSLLSPISSPRPRRHAGIAVTRHHNQLYMASVHSNSGPHALSPQAAFPAPYNWFLKRKRKQVYSFESYYLESIRVQKKNQWAYLPSSTSLQTDKLWNIFYTCVFSLSIPFTAALENF